MVIAEIKIWGLNVGAVIWDKERNLAIMEFEESFVDRNIDLAPITMPIEKLKQGDRIFSFPHLNEVTFNKLPGLLADSLPDTFGNKLINIWLTQNGRSPHDFTPVERLCYVGTRGMGALGFEPSLQNVTTDTEEIQLNELVEVAKKIMAQKQALDTSFKFDKTKALQQIIKIGTSAGGMRPKAIIAINNSDGKIISGYFNAPQGYDHWILKFDGVQDDIFNKPQGYGIIEYVYYLLAGKAGLIMSECKLLNEEGRSHFMTKRFDRANGNKIHMQTLNGMAHYDFNNIGSTSYEQLFQIMRKLKLGHDEIEQMYRRLVFNVVARNQDDHTKNTTFLLERNGSWKLSPAYDITYSFSPDVGKNTNKHQMSINGKREEINREDLMQIARHINIKKPGRIIEDIIESVSNWQLLAKEYGLEQGRINKIEKNLRLNL